MKAILVIMAMVLACATSFGQGVIVWNIDNNPGDETPPGPGALEITNLPPLSYDYTSTTLTVTDPGPGASDPITIDPADANVSISLPPDSFDSSDSLITVAPEPSPWAITLLSAGLVFFISRFSRRFQIRSARS